METFVTLFNINYLSRGLAMIVSLRKWMPETRIVVLCVDKETMDRLEALNFKDLILINIYEALDDQVLSLKQDRTLGEFCWTLTPIALEIGLQHSTNGRVTYLDADLFFFKSPQILLEEIRKSGKSITITPHDFSKHLEELIVYGKFCVQWITIYDNKQGWECLKNYKKQCLEWCFAYIDEERFGDQKYLDAWPQIHKEDLFIMEPKLGFGAPWNVMKHNLSFNEHRSFTINSKQLIFFHFHQFKIFNAGRFSWYSKPYGVITEGCRVMYQTYERAIIDVKKVLGPDYVADLHNGSWLAHKARSEIKQYIPSRIKKLIKKFSY